MVELAMHQGDTKGQGDVRDLTAIVARALHALTLKSGLVRIVRACDPNDPNFRTFERSEYELHAELPLQSRVEEILHVVSRVVRQTAFLRGQDQRVVVVARCQVHR